MPQANHDRFRRTPLRIALAYAVAAGIWILLSDKLLQLMTSSPEQALFLQTYKGVFFVAGTALLLYWLVRAGMSRLRHALLQEQDARLRLAQAMENARLSYFVYTPEDDALVLEVPAGVSGKNSTSSRHTSLQAFVHPNDLPEVRSRLVKHLQDRSAHFQAEHRLANGQNRQTWYLARGKKNEINGKTILSGTLMDISDQKNMEHTLVASRRELLTMADAIPDFIARYDRELRHVFVNQALCETMGIPRQELLGKTNAEAGMPQELLDTWVPALHEVLHTGKQRFVELTFPLHEKKMSLHVTMAPEYDDEGAINAVITVSRDISELKKAHEALLASEKRLNDAQRIAHVASFERDLTTGKGFWSDELYRMLGYAPGEKENSLDLFLQHVHPDDMDYVSKVIQDSFPSKAEFAGEFRYIRTNRQVRHGFISGRITRDENGRPLFYQGIVQDISERKRAAEEYALLATAIDQASECVLVTDARGVLQYVNPAFEKASGYRRFDILGHTPRILKSGRHEQSFYQELWQIISCGQVWHGRLVNRRKDGSLYEVDSTISPVRDSSGQITNYVALQRDVTERIQLERQLRQAQKMEAIGTLAGGVAHDFNNILAAIMGFAEIALLETPEELESVRESLRDILSGSRRGSELVRNILTFSRQGAQDKVPLEIQPLVKEALKLLRASLPVSIRIHEHLELQRGVIMADPSDIQQLLLNLCTNAGQAMGEEGGHLHLGLHYHEPEAEELARYPNLSPGPHMRLVVQDTGPGIAPEILERIFDPFFTTKAPGEGTGLGLSIVHGIAQANAGAVQVESIQGKGSTFTVLLPLSLQNKEIPPSSDMLQQGNQRILVVDDEEAVARSMEGMLQLMGHEVQRRANGREALELLQQEEEKFDLLVTDQMMPGMSGLDLAKRARELRPGLPVLLATGYGSHEHGAAAQAAGVHSVLAKPVDLVTLSLAVYDALGAYQSSPPDDGQEA